MVIARLRALTHYCYSSCSAIYKCRNGYCSSEGIDTFLEYRIPPVLAGCRNGYCSSEGIDTHQGFQCLCHLDPVEMVIARLRALTQSI